MTAPSLIVEPVTLRGKGVRLETLSESVHRQGLAEAITDGDLSSIPVTTVPRLDELGSFFEHAADALRSGDELAFATIDTVRDRVAGSTRFREIKPEHKRVEIGFTFLGASYQRSHVNTEAKLLMLEHAFDRWAVNRVELLTDVLNVGSCDAIARIGAAREGTLRSHMVMRDGRIRDSAVFSIVRTEWPGVRAALSARLGA